jgi:hypothetical protein
LHGVDAEYLGSKTTKEEAIPENEIFETPRRRDVLLDRFSRHYPELG